LGVLWACSSEGSSDPGLEPLLKHALIGLAGPFQ
jgi:hypothetical protein